MYLFVLVVRLFAGLIGGLIGALSRMTVHSARLAGVVVRDAQRPRPSAPSRPRAVGEKVALGFFAVMALLIAYAVIRY